jgi:hypothetical protein
MYNYHINR